MEIRQVAEAFAVSGQIAPADVAAIKAAGYRSIICNRPDNEEGAVPHEQIEAAAKEAGLAFRYLPAISGQLTQANVDDTAKALGELEGPVFAYCRSGARSTNLYTMAKQQG
ncbi:MAG: TIGR01244 family phosphatase [Rhizobiaceae bacterium]|nr:TIGR01244 family phosphatase [Rhizobiaceae bacterium]